MIGGGRQCCADSNSDAVPFPVGIPPPTCIHVLERVWREGVGGQAAVEFTFTVRMTRNYKTVILPLIVVFAFSNGCYVDFCSLEKKLLQVKHGAAVAFLQYLNHPMHLMKR